MFIFAHTYIFLDLRQRFAMNDYGTIMASLRALGNEEKSRHLSGFFKTGEGQYGYGDKFLGLPVPLTRSVAKRHKDEPAETAARRGIP